MTTLAVVPAYTPVGDPVTAMVTGKVEVPPLVVPMTPTVETVPKIGCVAPVGVIVTCIPFFSLARSAAPTVELTSHAFVAMTTTWAEDADEAEVLPDPVDPVEPVVPVAPDVLDPPVTESPTATLTAATVPAIEEVSDAWPRASWAAVSLLCAEVTWALAEAIWPLLAAA